MKRWLLAMLLVIAGCDGGESLPEDTDAGGRPDAAGPGAVDAALDAPSLDAGADGSGPIETDAGSGGEDAGPIEVDAGPPEPLRLYLAPDGDDARDGLSPSNAILTVSRAHAILVAMAPDRDVELRIAPGRYHGQTVSWTFTMPEHRIRFMPLGDDGDRPIFDGCLADGSCPGGTWLRLRHSAGERTNLHFEYIRVERYQTAISLDGNRNAMDATNGHNRIFGCYFASIGNVFAPSLSPSTAAVRLVNSTDNEIVNNHFVDVVNTTSGGLIHAIYAAHMSRRNRIERNRFLRSTGDPVRIRDFSNDNIIRDNRFIRVGVFAGYSDWYCDHDVRDDCTKVDPECPSWGNQFRDNTLDGTWTCGNLGTWHLFQGDSTTGCAPPSADARRVRTSGNVQTDVPCSME